MRKDFTNNKPESIRKYAIDVFPFFWQQDITQQGTLRRTLGARRHPYPYSHNSIPQNRGIASTLMPDHRGREKGLMSMKHTTSSTTTKYNLSKEQEMDLIMAIRQGDFDAENRLFEALYAFMKKTHEFGPDGITGKAKPGFSSNFETALADYDILEIFRKCVNTYNPDRGSFRNHLAFRMNMAAKDRIRNRSHSEGLDNPDNVEYMDTLSDYDENQVDSRVVNLFDTKTAEWSEARDADAEQHDFCFDLIDMIEEHFGEDSIEFRYIELYCSLSTDAKKHTGEICEALGCSRQTLGNIRKRIRDAFGGMWPTAA